MGKNPQLRFMRLEGEVKSAESSASVEAAIRETVAVFQRYRLDYGRAIAVARVARARLGIAPQPATKRQPRLLTDAQRTDFISAVEQAGNAQHILLSLLLDGTQMRASEVVGLRRAAVELNGRTLEIVSGEGRDCSLTTPTKLCSIVEGCFASSETQVYLFESRHKAQLSLRWLQMLARTYGDHAGIPEMKCRLLVRRNAGNEPSVKYQKREAQPRIQHVAANLNKSRLLTACSHKEG